MLKISSTHYNIQNLDLILEQDEPDEFIFGTEEKGSFVVSPKGDDVKAFGYIEEGRFFGQFTYDGRTYFVDPLPRGQEGGNLVPFDEMKGLIGKLEPLFSYYSDYLLGVGSAGKVVESDPAIAYASDDGGVFAQIARRNVTQGNICRMRIIIDKFLLKLFDNNKSKMRTVVKLYEETLNDIYEKAGVKVKVNNKELLLKFKVVDLLFHDEDYCHGKDSAGSSQHCDFHRKVLIDHSVVVSCKEWQKDEAMLEAHASADHSDVCLSYHFTSHIFFRGVVGKIFPSHNKINLSFTKGWPIKAGSARIMPKLYSDTARKGSKKAIPLGTSAL